ncbi:hypothetical protein B4U37_19980 [Sutcliffiella horikoshii]|uniref:SbsA Ig-like domain-containing protein n=1 Tax=Sutcliffiella horikoshii TaxID=79883 RepID=A0ABN4ZJN7_9BACI|nr:hypothetical protein [Sutcliffiella horikoshii]ART78180.1 hypothetical protein B4U37_19980 [Sutcliffiella horikoshii]
MKKIILWLLIIAGVFGAGYGGYSLFLSDKTAANSLLENNVENMDPDEMIDTKFDVPIDHVWKISFDDELESATVTKKNVKVLDEEGEELDVPVVLSDSLKTIEISPPSENYKKGAYYEVHISSEVAYTDGFQVSKPFAMAFVTARDEVEEVSFNEALIYIEETDVVEVGDTVITLKNNEETALLVEEDIILIPKEELIAGYHQAYKIISSKKENDSIVLAVELPAFHELFESIDIYKEYEVLTDQTVIIPAEGVDVELSTAYSPDNMIGSDRSETVSKKGEYEVNTPPKEIKAKIDKESIRLSFKNFKFDIEDTTIELDGYMDMHYPTFLLDYQLGLGGLKRLNALYSSEMEAGVESAMEVELSDYIKTLKREKKYNGIRKRDGWLIERDIPLAKILAPTGIPLVFIENRVNLTAGIDGKGKVVSLASVDKTVQKQFGIVKAKGKYNGHMKVDREISTSVIGSGMLSLKAGPLAAIALKGGDVLGLGMEGTAKGYADGEVKIGGKQSSLPVDETALTLEKLNDTDFVFCSNFDVGFLLGASFVVDSVKDYTLWELVISQKKYPAFQYNSCKELVSLKASEDSVNTNSGSELKLDIVGKFKDAGSGKTSDSSLLTGDKVMDMTVTTLDKNIAKAKFIQINKKDEKNPKSKKAKYKLSITTLAEPDGEQTEVIVTYNDKKTRQEHSVTIPIVLEDQKKLTDDEIQSVMNQYLEWFLSAKEFMAAPSPTDNLTEYVDANLSSFEESVSTLVTERFSRDNESFIRNNISTFGKLENAPKFDVRFEILENTPSKIMVKSVIMPQVYPAAYIEFGSNVILTAIKDGTEWYIDEIAYSQAPEDPVNFTWPELKYYELEYLGEMDLRTTVGYQATTFDYAEGETKVYLVRNPFGEGIDGMTAASGNIVKIPEGSLPEHLKPKPVSTGEQDTDTIVLEYSMEEDGTVSANFEQESTITIQVGQRLEIQRIDNLDRNKFYDNIMVSAGPVEWDASGGNSPVLVGKKAGVTELSIIPFSYEHDLAHVINIEVIE